MAATPIALASFGGRMLHDRIVAAQTFDWMLKPAKLSDGSDAGESDYKVGFGWRVSPDEDGAATAHHAGVAPGVRSALVLWRQEKVAVSLLSNACGPPQSIAVRGCCGNASDMPRNLVPAACPTKASDTPGPSTVTGQRRARFTLGKGVCAGSITSDGELRNWLSGGTQKAASALTLVGLDEAGGLARAGLVTPFGIYDWRAQPNGTFKVMFGGTRELVVRLTD